MNTNELVDRYVHAVVGGLPKAQRDDVARELRTLVDDMAAERAAARGAAVDEAAVVESLRALGQPDAVAERYGRPRPHLIGPAYFAAFKAVTGVVVAVLGVLFLVSTVWSLSLAGGPPAEVPGRLLEALLRFGTTALANVGLIALIFAAIERASPAGPASEAADWDPRSLPPVVDADRLDRGGQTAELAFDLVAMVMFNWVVQWRLPIVIIGPEVTRTWVDFTPAALAWVPWVNATFVLSIALSLVLLWRGRWQVSTRLADIAINVVSVAVLVRVLALDRIAVAGWVDTLARMGLGVVVVIVVLDVAGQVVRLARGWSGAAAVAEPERRQAV